LKETKDTTFAAEEFLKKPLEQYSGRTSSVGRGTPFHGGAENNSKTRKAILKKLRWDRGGEGLKGSVERRSKSHVQCRKEGGRQTKGKTHGLKKRAKQRRWSPVKGTDWGNSKKGE